MSAMPCEIEVLFTPAEFRVLGRRDLSRSFCVVFDILRATSTIVTALAHGAKAVIPVEEISEALALCKQNPGFLLAGERDGLRISGALTGGVEFDLGNSPREFTPDRVAGKTIVSTTTNGTRALRACAGAKRVLAASFLDLAATAGFLVHESPAHVLLVCAGTGEDTALEDVLGAGALCALLARQLSGCHSHDSAEIALAAFERAQNNLSAAVRQSRNARRLLGIRELRDDVEFCLRRDCFPVVAGLSDDGALRAIG
jgi:2-phosphosulfolactate phosphatase